MTDRTTPTLAHVIQVALDAARMGLRTSLPGRIASYNASTQRAEVKLQINPPVPTPDGGHVYEELPPLYDVPIAHPGGGGFYAHFPLKQGDFVWVQFSQHSMDEFLRTGKRSDPRYLRTHGLFPSAIPARDPSEPAQLPAPPDGKLVIAEEGGTAIAVSQDEVQLGSTGASDPVAKAPLVGQESDRVNNMINTIVQAITNAATAPMDGGATFKAALVAALASLPTQKVDTAASRVKAE